MINTKGRLFRIMFLLATMFAGPTAGIANPVERGQFSMVGSGQLTWWGMTVYDAVLYAPEGIYRPEKPHYLEITYRFSFSREQLANRSLEEIERLHGKSSDRDALLAQFRSIFPDVTRGDRIIALHYPGKRADFYHGDQPLGQIESAGLAAEFFSIWLDPDTGEPDLRAGLLGYHK